MDSILNKKFMTGSTPVKYEIHFTGVSDQFHPEIDSGAK